MTIELQSNLASGLTQRSTELEIAPEQTVLEALSLLSSVSGDVRHDRLPLYIFLHLASSTGMVHGRRGSRVGDGDPTAILPPRAAILATDGSEGKLEDALVRVPSGLVLLQSGFGKFFVSVAARSAREADDLLAETLANCPVMEETTVPFTFFSAVKPG